MVDTSIVNLAELGVLVVGVIIALRQLNDIKETRETELETRQAQLFMQIYNRFSEVEFRENFNEVLTREWRDYEDYVKKYGRFTRLSKISKFITSSQRIL